MNIEEQDLEKHRQSVPKKIIDVIRQDGDFLLIADFGKGYKGRIHQSLIADNKLEIKNKKLIIGREMYQSWFKDSIAKKFEELCDLFYLNISLFIDKHEIILNDPRYYTIRSPRMFYGGTLSGGYFSTLGSMILLWVNEPGFSWKCDCGGQAIIYQFGGSDLSGGGVGYALCLKCGNIIKSSCSYGRLRESLSKHRIEPVSCEAITIRELIKVLKKKHHRIDTEEKDDFQSFPNYLTYSIWRKNLTQPCIPGVIL